MHVCILERLKKPSIADGETGSADDELAAGDEKVTRTAGRGRTNVVDARSQDGGKIIRGPDGLVTRDPMFWPC